MLKSAMRELRYTEWRAEGERRFGPDHMRWRFRCPSCKSVVTPADYKAAGVPDGAVAFSCVGRWMPETTATLGKTGQGFCNYAGGGLFKLNPIKVTDPEGIEHQVFEFAEG
jgi:hypothetical protein